MREQTKTVLSCRRPTWLMLKAKQWTYSASPTWWWTLKREGAHCLLLWAPGYSYSIYGKCGWQTTPGPCCDRRDAPQRARRQNTQWATVTSWQGCNAGLTTVTNTSCSVFPASVLAASLDFDAVSPANTWCFRVKRWKCENNKTMTHTCPPLNTIFTALHGWGTFSLLRRRTYLQHCCQGMQHVQDAVLSGGCI